MAATFNATMTQQVSREAVASAKVTAIPGVIYTMDDYQAFFNGVLSAVTAVPTPLAGGEHGHSYLVLTNKELKEYTGMNITESGAANLGTDVRIRTTNKL